MKQCSKCGLHNPEFINVCTGCGNDLNPEKSRDIIESRKKLKEKNLDDPSFYSSQNQYKDEGYTVTEIRQKKNVDPKNPMIATLISFISGIFSFSGLGLVYLGLIRRFVAELLVGILLFLVMNAEITANYFKLMDTFRTGTLHLKYVDLFGFALILIVYIIWWMYTTWDTHRCCESLNSNKKLPKLFGILKI